MGVYLGKPVMIEVPAYTVIARSGVAEIRRYEPYVIASVRSTGGELKGGDGFRMLARYIGAFGTPENEGASGKPESIKMTAPVVTAAEESDSYWCDDRRRAGIRIPRTRPGRSPADPPRAPTTTTTTG